MAEMTVTVRLFAMLRERAGRDEIELELGDGSTVADAPRGAQGLLAAGRGAGADAGAAAVNREYVSDDSPLSPGDEVALIPPVSGGAPAPARACTHASPASRFRRSRCRVRSATGRGAIVTFQGTTRTWTGSSTRPTRRWRSEGSRRSCASA